MRSALVGAGDSLAVRRGAGGGALGDCAVARGSGAGAGNGVGGRVTLDVWLAVRGSGVGGRVGGELCRSGAGGGVTLRRAARFGRGAETSDFSRANSNVASGRS